MKLSIYDATKTVCGGNRNFQSHGEIESMHEFEFDEVIDYGCMLFYKGCLGSRCEHNQKLLS